MNRKSLLDRAGSAGRMPRHESHDRSLAHPGSADIHLPLRRHCRPGRAIGPSELRLLDPDYHGARGTPELGDPWFGVGGDFTVSGNPTTPFSIQITCGAQTATWKNVKLTAGHHWWWGPFDSSLKVRSRPA